MAAPRNAICQGVKQREDVCCGNSVVSYSQFRLVHCSSAIPADEAVAELRQDAVVGDPDSLGLANA